VAALTSEACREGVSPPALDAAAAGYLASVVLSDTAGCSDGRQTWTIRAEPGQQVRLTLYDFYHAAAAATQAATPGERQPLNHRPISPGQNNIRRRPLIRLDHRISLASQTARKALPPTIAKSRNRKMVDCPSYY